MGRRSMIALAYVHTYIDRTGKRRHYFRRKNKQTPLPGIPGSAEFMAAYAAANSASREPAKPEPQAGSIAHLIARYQASTEFRNLADSTKQSYRRVFTAFAEKHGHRRADQLGRKHIEAIIAAEGDKDGAAHYLLKRLRTLMRFGVRAELIARDPTAGIPLPKIGEVHTWTDAELRTYEDRWPIGTKQRLAYSLLLFIGQRESDARLLPWPDADGFRITQQKTGTSLIVPVHPALGEILAATPREHMVVLVTAHGRPYTKKGIGNLMSKAIREAGLPSRCKAHGLRKAAARRLAEAGATEKQIAAITGHKSLAEVERYTRAADQIRLARDAIEKQAANDGWANRVANGRPK